MRETLTLLTNADRSTDTKKPKKNFFGEKTDAPFLLKVLSLQANIRNRPFDKKSPRHPEVGVLGLRATMQTMESEMKRSAAALRWSSLWATLTVCWPPMADIMIDEMLKLL